MRTPLLAALLTVLTATSAAPAWWDTQVRAQTAEPAVASFEAAVCDGARKTVDDRQARGGRGGNVAVVQPGELLSFGRELPPSVYSVWIVARAREGDLVVPDAPERELDLPGGKVTARCPRPLVYAKLTVRGPDGAGGQWRLPIACRADHAVVAKLYFPVNVAGRWRLAAGLDGRSEIPLLIDRIEIRDVLGHCPRQAVKTGGYSPPTPS